MENTGFEKSEWPIEWVVSKVHSRTNTLHEASGFEFRWNWSIIEFSVQVLDCSHWWSHRLTWKIGDTVSLILEKWSTSTCTWRYNERPDDPNTVPRFRIRVTLVYSQSEHITTVGHMISYVTYHKFVKLGHTKIQLVAGSVRWKPT